VIPPIAMDRGEFRCAEFKRCRFSLAMARAKLKKRRNAGLSFFGHQTALN